MEVVERDGYRVDSLTTGVKLYEVWLPAADQRALAALARVRAAVSVSAAAPGEESVMSDHMFTVWVVEAENGGDAALIAAAASPKPGSDTVILGLQTDCLVAVLVARSVRVGIQPRETQTTVGRFVEGLSGALAQAGGG